MTRRRFLIGEILIKVRNIVSMFSNRVAIVESIYCRENTYTVPFPSISFFPESPDIITIDCYPIPNRPIYFSATATIDSLTGHSAHKRITKYTDMALGTNTSDSPSAMVVADPSKPPADGFCAWNKLPVELHDMVRPVWLQIVKMQLLTLHFVDL